MKRFAPLIALVVLFAFAAVPIWAVLSPTPPPPPTPTVVEDRSPAAPYAQAVATITGVAISPLLGTGALGLYENLRAETPEERAALPWYAHWEFILPALVLVAICAAKDSLGATLPPGFKKPLDVLEAVENQLSGLVAAGAVVPLTLAALSRAVVDAAPAVPATGPEAALLQVGTATVMLGAIDATWLLNLLLVPAGVVVFAVVWMASNAINALILLSPWGAIDAVLKLARTALLGLLVVVTVIEPWAGAALSLVIILIAWLVAGWSFRLTVFATIFSWDFLTFGKSRHRVEEQGGNALFSSNALTRQGVPMRTWGRLKNEPENGKLVFRYRPWLVLPEKTLDVKLEAAAVGKGLFISSIQNGDTTAFVLPPRYGGHEGEVVRVYGIEGGVKVAGLLKAWGALKELFGGGSARAQVTP